jgi:hypothetical protein
MKIAGQKVSKQVHTDVLVLPRGSDDPIVFTAQGIADFKPFEAMCPLPEPPGRLTKDGFIPNTKDETYVSQMENHNRQRVGWMVLTSLVDVEWDQADLDNPKTWPKWEDDMENAGFSSIERNLVLGLVLDVNQLDDKKLKAARESFIQGQEQARNASSSLTSEPKSTPSGDPASEQA